MRGFIVLGATALLLALPGGAIAQTDTRINIWIEPDGTALVSGEDGGLDGQPDRLEVYRGGVPIGERLQTIDWGSGVKVAPLLVGDQVRLWEGSELRSAHVFDGLPSVEGVCAGSSSFDLAHGSLEIYGASAGQGADYTQATIGHGEPAAMTMSRPLAAGERLTLYTGAHVGWFRVSQSRTLTVPDCSQPPVPSAPTDAEVLSGLKAGLRPARTGIERRTRTTLAVPFTFAEQATVRLRIVHGRTVIGTGRESGAGETAVRVRLNAPGRRLLSGRERAALTVKATLTPARAGARPQSASLRVTYRRR
jgi:hypothetical protein